MSAGPEQELSDLERALARLVPQAPNLQRDRLLFTAGEMCGPTCPALLGGKCPACEAHVCSLDTSFWFDRGPQIVTRVVVERETRPIPNEPAPTLPEERTEEEPESTTPPLALPRPVLSGSDTSPPYWTIHRNIPHFGDRALPYLTPSKDGLPNRHG